MKIHYGTAIGALSLTVVHILMRLTQDFHESLAYENVIANYESVAMAGLIAYGSRTIIMTSMGMV
jgi:succinate dehydrogenase / fumarate reductase membrane anchor subunit